MRDYKQAYHEPYRQRMILAQAAEVAKASGDAMKQLLVVTTFNEWKQTQELHAGQQIIRSAPIAFYVFNADRITNGVSTGYGSYAEGELLKTLATSLVPLGGWTKLPTVVHACHGDLFADSALGETPALRVLAGWMSAGTYGIDASRLDADLLARLKTAQNPDYFPYVVGVQGVPEPTLSGAHDQLRTRKIVGYLGMFVLVNAPMLVQVASELTLPHDMQIRGINCTGWLAPQEAYDEAGLRRV